MSLQPLFAHILNCFLRMELLGKNNKYALHLTMYHKILKNTYHTDTILYQTPICPVTPGAVGGGGRNMFPSWGK